MEYALMQQPSHILSEILFGLQVVGGTQNRTQQFSISKTCDSCRRSYFCKGEIIFTL